MRRARHRHQALSLSLSLSLFTASFPPTLSHRAMNITLRASARALTKASFTRVAFHSRDGQTRARPSHLALASGGRRTHRMRAR